MVIQHIVYNKSNLSDTDIIKISTFASPRSLDEFDINIIDFSDKSIWYNNENNTTNINCSRDLHNLNTMISNSKRTKIVFIYPQNLNYNYKYEFVSTSKGYQYRNSIELKNMLGSLNKSIMHLILGDVTPNLLYENTNTKINNKDIEANFYFNIDNGCTYSIISNKVTTICYKDYILTTLRLINQENILEFLKHIKLIEDKAEIPEWATEIEVLDDNEKKELIENKLRAIEASKLDIEAAQKIIDKNNRIKSILYTNGDELVEVIFDILGDILSYDLSGFKDEKKEDFIIKLEDITFIGEIKGINTNIKSGNVSQLDLHLQSYLDNSNIVEDEQVKSLLIINHQRNKPLVEREPVHDTQIKLAERNGSLIIETSTLLHIFENYKRGEMTSEEIETIFSENTGIISF